MELKFMILFLIVLLIATSCTREIHTKENTICIATIKVNSDNFGDASIDCYDSEYLARNFARKENVTMWILGNYSNNTYNDLKNLTLAENGSLGKYLNISQCYDFVLKNALCSRFGINIKSK